MTLFHAVVWLDHHNALVQQFSDGKIEAAKIKDHTHYTRQHGSNVRAIHEFYADVCDALKGVEERIWPIWTSATMKVPWNGSPFLLSWNKTW